MMYADKLPVGAASMLKPRILNSSLDESTLQIMLSQMKDPTTALILSILLGAYGIDRFYIGDVGIGVGKLLTCGGLAIWAIIDIFLIMDATRQKNLENLMARIR